ncbi:ABC transporter ATP-binding protein [Clostridium sp. HBUAS56010]|uniref:ABC transporter ATP-binding protein n=1 Tax=Clostridium sp. HBUAS56010 TaxID=2571127 RepID=UPI0011780CCE|nr:ABC transporter ATP-binding protein [Clostridium sp. HBUAS56010]
MIKLKNIEVNFGSFTALNNINIDIKEGEFFTFLGPSGCGKTTTLRTITGFLNPAKGSISVRGKEITHQPVEKRNIGMVFQSYALFPTMSVYENIAFGLKVKKIAKEEVKTKVLAMALKVDLTEEQLLKKVSELSGGQQQRVAIARALVTSPDIICLDEPLSNLDARLRIQLRNELKDLQQRFGITTIYVTHDQEEALTLSDRIAVFNKGIIEQIGEPAEIYNHSATEFVCNFIGDINRLPREVLLLAGADKHSEIDLDKHCYIRLEHIHVNKEATDQDMELQAVVMGYDYYGLYIKYKLEFGGHIFKVVEKNSGNPLYEKGSTVTLSFSPSNIMQY